jgi:putative salt-induced outer membrane protein YdiY
MKAQPPIILTLVFILATVALDGGEPSAPDRIQTRDGAILIGLIEEDNGEIIRLSTAYAGILVIDRAEVVGVSSAAQADSPAAGSAAGAASPAPAAAGARPAAPPKPEGRWDNWTIDLGLNLTGNRGNTEKFDLALSADIKMDREYDRLNIYSRYAYGTNRGAVSANEIILGSQYTNFFFDGLGIFFRGELEHDDFEGLLYRSTSASGISWKIRDEEKLRVETRSGLSYRYEDYKDDGYEDYPGMDFGLDLDWTFAEWARLKASYTYLPSVADFEDYIIKQDTGLNFPLDYSNLWELRIGIASKYNNQPDLGKEKLDHRYYARLIASWH